MNLKPIVLGVLVGSIGVLAAMVSAPAEAQYGSAATCAPYNSQWMICKRTVYDPTEQAWVEETYFQRWPNQDATIEVLD